MQIKINTKEMIRFYENFDAVDFKYHSLLECYKDRKEGESFYSEEYLKYKKHEDANQFSELTRKNYGSVRANLDLVYARKEITDSVVKIYDLVMHKLICQYINIDGIERMFSEKYADFEWDMHLGIDYSKHSMKFYRDHFIHQVRDAYTMHMLLKNGYEERVMSVLADAGRSKVSRYVCKHLQQQEELLNSAVSRFEGKSIECIRKHYLRNIVYMSSYMAAIFHDIGYPEVANMANRRRVTDYITNIYNLETNFANFDRIVTLLQNSLLFRVVSSGEIQNKIEGGNPDHGAVSAIIFLMHFYENGAIHRLEPYKLCAVELAGLAIYNHTAKYMHCDKKLNKEKAAYYKISFVLNPISYLLRICDDLQEWDRIYFEISEESNLIVCEKCKTPVIRARNDDKVYYRCNCNSIEKSGKTGIFSPVFHYDAFPYRRIYNITVCEELEVTIERTKNIFHLKYNLENLLHMAYINSNYAKYRISELNQLKRLFDFQSGIPHGYVKYFVSANPILIKVKIIEAWLAYMKNSRVNQEVWWGHFRTAVSSASSDAKRKSALNECFEESASELQSLLLEKVHSLYGSPGQKTYTVALNDYMESIVSLYSKLCYLLVIYQKVNCNYLDREKKELALNFLEEAEEIFMSGAVKEEVCTEDSDCLLHDCFVQFRRMYEDIGVFEFYPEEYYEQFEEDKISVLSFYACCDSFVSARKYVPLNERSQDEKKKLDAFTDLYLFHDLGSALS